MGNERDKRVDYAFTMIDFGQGPGVTGLPVAKKLHSVADPGRPFSAIEVLTSFYGEDFNIVLKHFVELDQAKIKQAGVLKDAQTLSFVSYTYKRTESRLRQRVDTNVVDFLVNVMVEDERNRRACVDIRIRYVLDMRICHQTVIGPLIFVEKTFVDPVLKGYSIATDEYLLPILYAKDYEKVAHQMLEDYFPDYKDTLGSKGFVLEAEELARRMHLNVHDVRFADKTAMGQIYYDFGEVDLLNDSGGVVRTRIKPGTILISRDHCQNPAVRNSTIVHECCHMYLDSTFFLLQMMTSRPYASYTSRRREKKHRNSPLDWMELQCEKLPAYLMLESGSTGAFVEEQTRGSRTIDRLKSAIQAVAQHFRVSKAMAKYRMIELGYKEAEGIGCYVDGRSVPDHGCGGRWPEGVTYTISSYDAAVLCSEASSVAQKVRSGAYIYVENHFCLNDTRYITHDRAGQLFLTPWARSHIDECCLAFRPVGRYGNTGYSSSWVARKKNEEPAAPKYLPTYELVAQPGTAEYKKENSIFADDSYLWGKLYAQLPGDFKGAIQMIVKERGIKYGDLAGDCGLDRKSIYDTLNSERPTLERVIVLCVALKTPYYISERLIYLSRNTLLNSERECILRQFLLEQGKLTIERCNDILKARNLLPLIDEEKQRKHSFEA